MELLASTIIWITEKQVQEIFLGELEKLTEGYWYVEEPNEQRSGKFRPGVYRTIDSYGHGSDIDEWVAPINHPDYDVQMLARRLLVMLKEKSKREPK